MSNYNLNSVSNTSSVLFKRIPVISYIYGRFLKHLKNRQIPYQSVRGPLGCLTVRLSVESLLTRCILGNFDAFVGVY